LVLKLRCHLYHDYRVTLIFDSHSFSDILRAEPGEGEVRKGVRLILELKRKTILGSSNENGVSPSRRLTIKPAIFQPRREETLSDEHKRHSISLLHGRIQQHTAAPPSNYAHKKSNSKPSWSPWVCQNQKCDCRYFGFPRPETWILALVLPFTLLFRYLSSFVYVVGRLEKTLCLS